MSAPHKNQKHFAGGIDNGFGNYKLLIEGHDLVVIPSYLTEEKMEAVPGRVRLGDHEYTVGDSARRCGKYFTRNVDETGSKRTHALPMLLGALAHLPHRREWYLHLAASIHDSDNYGQELTETLSGEHECILSGMPSRVVVDVVKVIPEGMGSLVDIAIPKKLTLIDFGNGTTLLSRYHNGKREMHEPTHFGVENLIDLIAKEMKGKNNGLQGDAHLIRLGLESGELNYGRSQSFKPIYKKCLTDWFDKYLKKTLKKAKDAYEQGDEVWCIGGGCLLPNLADNLCKAGFKIHQNPIEANVRGLLSIAKKSMKVKA